MKQLGWLFLISLFFFGQANESLAAPTYRVYQNSNLLMTFDDKITAIAFAKKWSHSSVRVGDEWIWNNYPYRVFQKEQYLKEVSNYREAITYASQYEHASVRKPLHDIWVWDNYSYEVYRNGDLVKRFNQLLEAFDFSTKTPNSMIKKEESSVVLYTNTNQYQVFQNETLLNEYQGLKDAIPFAKMWENSRVIRKTDQKELWKFRKPLQGFILHNAPLINQNPELPRGCEVTTIAMLLNHVKIQVTKMELAEKVIKDPTPYKKTNAGTISWGDPHRGFVGDMYDMTKPGYGVYNEPLAVLVNQFTNGQAVNLSGVSTEDLFYFLEEGNPVAVIINSRFKPVHDWVSWKGPHGQVKATYREHAVLLVGYDTKYVYVNDPLSGQKNRKLNRKFFEQGWIQMGRQAVTYLD